MLEEKERTKLNHRKHMGQAKVKFVVLFVFDFKISGKTLKIMV